MIELTEKEFNNLTTQVDVLKTAAHLFSDNFQVTLIEKEGSLYVRAKKFQTVLTDTGTMDVEYTIEVPLERHSDLLKIETNPVLSMSLLDKLRT